MDCLNIVRDPESEDFLKVSKDNFLKQVVMEPTRGDNILDLVLTDNGNMIRNVQVGEELGSSDHRAVVPNLWYAYH